MPPPRSRGRGRRSSLVYHRHLRGASQCLRDGRLGAEAREERVRREERRLRHSGKGNHCLLQAGQLRRQQVTQVGDSCRSQMPGGAAQHRQDLRRHHRRGDSRRQIRGLGELL